MQPTKLLKYEYLISWFMVTWLRYNCYNAILCGQSRTQLLLVSIIDPFRLYDCRSSSHRYCNVAACKSLCLDIFASTHTIFINQNECASSGIYLILHAPSNFFSFDDAMGFNLLLVSNLVYLDTAVTL